MNAGEYKPQVDVTLIKHRTRAKRHKLVANGKRGASLRPNSPKLSNGHAGHNEENNKYHTDEENNGFGVQFMLGESKTNSNSVRMHGIDSKLLAELNEDNIDETILSEEIDKISEQYDLKAVTWRQRMVHFLHTIPVELFLMSLVILDVVIILIMVALDIYIMQQQLKLTDSKGTEVLNFLSTRNLSDTQYNSILANTTIKSAYKHMIKSYGSTQYQHTLDDSNLTHRYRRAAVKSITREDYRAEETYSIASLIYILTTANSVLHYLSVAVLAVFVIEVILKIIGYGKNYLKSKMEVVDGIIIMISCGLDIAITWNDFTDDVGKTILIVFLIWRVIRILNAMVLTSRARTMFRLKLLRKSKKIAEDKNRELQAQVADQQTEIKKLRLIARTYGAEEHEIQAANVLSKRSVSSTQAGLKNMMAQLVQLNTKIASVSCGNLPSQLTPDSRRPSAIGDSTLHRRDSHERKSDFLEQGELRQRSVSDATYIRQKSRPSECGGEKTTLLDSELYSGVKKDREIGYNEDSSTESQEGITPFIDFPISEVSNEVTKSHEPPSEDFASASSQTQPLLQQNDNRHKYAANNIDSLRTKPRKISIPFFHKLTNGDHHACVKPADNQKPHIVIEKRLALPFISVTLHNSDDSDSNEEVEQGEITHEL